MSTLTFPAKRLPVKTVPQTVADAFTQFEKSIGGRPALIAALSITELTPEIEQVLCAIGDPLLDKEPLADICYAHGIQPGQLIMAYHKAQMQAVQVLALTKVVAHVPEVIAEIVRMALPRTEVCSVCQGKGMVAAPRKKNRGRKPAPLPCTACGAKGSVHLDGMGPQQERILDLARLVSKGGGVNVAVQQTNVSAPVSGGGIAGSPLGQLQQAVQAALQHKLSPPAPDGRVSEPQIVDATVIPEPAQNGQR